jgi:hypothetical protein
MKSSILTLLLSLSITAFSQAKDSIITKMVNVKNIVEIEKMELDYCKSFSLEIVGLYPIMKSLPSSTDDKGTLAKSLLLKNGFTKIDSGLGNWQKGPRVISSEYIKGNCNCKVFKKYYFNEKQKDGYFDLRITERLICNADIFMDN